MTGVRGLPREKTGTSRRELSSTPQAPLQRSTSRQRQQLRVRRAKEALEARRAAEIAAMPLHSRLIMRLPTNRPFWSSPHAPKDKARAAEGWAPIDREREEYRRLGKPWPPKHPLEVVLLGAAAHAGGAPAAGGGHSPTH